MYRVSFWPSCEPSLTCRWKKKSFYAQPTISTLKSHGSRLWLPKTVKWFCILKEIMTCSDRNSVPPFLTFLFSSLTEDGGGISARDTDRGNCLLLICNCLLSLNTVVTVQTFCGRIILPKYIQNEEIHFVVLRLLTSTWSCHFLIVSLCLKHNTKLSFACTFRTAIYASPLHLLGPMLLNSNRCDNSKT